MYKYFDSNTWELDLSVLGVSKNYSALKLFYFNKNNKNIFKDLEIEVIIIENNYSQLFLDSDEGIQII